jgi:hypothetical protein
MLIVVAAILMSAGTALARHRSSPALPAVEVEGVIKSISSAQIVVTIGGNHDVTVAITADTIFRKGDLAIAPAVLKAGDRVEVKAVMKDNVLTAALIKLESAENQHPELVEINGVIKSVSPAELVVTDAQLHDVTVKITADTVIRKGDHIATTGDLAIADRVEVKASVSAGVNTAVSIHAQGAEQEREEANVNGVVTVVGSDQITVHGRSGDVVVKTDSNTRIRRDDRQITLSDIHAGDAVEAQGTRVDDHTMLARSIELLGSGGHH